MSGLIDRVAVTTLALLALAMFTLGIFVIAPSRLTCGIALAGMLPATAASVASLVVMRRQKAGQGE